MTELTPIAIAELGIAENVEKELKLAGIDTIGDLQSKTHLKKIGLATDTIDSICCALHQFGASLPVG